MKTLGSKFLKLLFLGAVPTWSIFGCAPVPQQARDFKAEFMQYCSANKEVDAWDKLEIHPDLLANKEFLKGQISDPTIPECQHVAYILYRSVSKEKAALAVLRPVALESDGKTVTAVANSIENSAARREFERFLAENHKSKWPLLTSILRAKHEKDLKTFNEFKEIATRRIKKGEFSPDDVRSIQSRFEFGGKNNPVGSK